MLEKVNFPVTNTIKNCNSRFISYDTISRKIKLVYFCRYLNLENRFGGGLREQALCFYGGERFQRFKRFKKFKRLACYAEFPSTFKPFKLFKPLKPTLPVETLAGGCSCTVNGNYITSFDGAEIRSSSFKTVIYVWQGNTLINAFSFWI